VATDKYKIYNPGKQANQKKWF